jgi:hypothetical protein
MKVSRLEFFDGSEIWVNPREVASLRPYIPYSVNDTTPLPSTELQLSGVSNGWIIPGSVEEVAAKIGWWVERSDNPPLHWLPVR